MRALRHDEVLLALVAGERLLESSCGFFVTAGEYEHLTEVGVGLGLGVEHLRLVADRDRLVRQPLCLGVVASACEDLRPDLPPDQMRDRIIARAELFRLCRPRLGVVETIRRVERLCQVPRGRGEGP